MFLLLSLGTASKMVKRDVLFFFFFLNQSLLIRIKYQPHQKKKIAHMNIKLSDWKAASLLPYERPGLFSLF